MTKTTTTTNQRSIRAAWAIVKMVLVGVAWVVALPFQNPYLGFLILHIACTIAMIELLARDSHRT